MGYEREAVSFAREILRALGVPPQGSTLITTDNLSNQRVATGAGAPSRSLHFLRRYGVLKQRIRSGEVNVQHIPDEQMPADFLTKWIGQKKLDKSIAYATNSRSLNKP